MLSMSPQDIARAVEVLRSGGVLAYPTEAVWGLGCDPWHRGGVQRILDLKGRDPDKGLIMVAADAEQLAPWLSSLPADQRARVYGPSPRPTTWVVPDPEGRAPRWVKGEHAGVALRISAHPLVVALCRAFGQPVISTSANPAGRPPARDQAGVERYFGAAVDYCLPGATGGEVSPSVVRDVVSGETLRGESERDHPSP